MKKNLLTSFLILFIIQNCAFAQFRDVRLNTKNLTLTENPKIHLSLNHDKNVELSQNSENINFNSKKQYSDYKWKHHCRLDN